MIEFSFVRFRKILPFFFFFLLKTGLWGQIIPIKTARQLGPGNTVTVRGIVTNGPEFGFIRYIQDGTAGIGCFPGAGSMAGVASPVKLGDSIEVTGPMVNFSNLLEISPITSFQIISSGNPSPAPAKLLFSELDEPFEGQLVEVDCANFALAGSPFVAQGQYQIVNPQGEIGEIYLRTGHPLINTTIPTGSLRVAGVLSHFQADYQILPRSVADFSSSSCFYISKPELVSFSKTSLEIEWTTSLSGSTVIQYGPSPVLGEEIIVAGATTNHSILIPNLMPGTIYWVKAISQNGPEIIESEEVPFATESNSTGQVKVFFTENVDETVGGGQVFPDGDSPDEAMQEIFNRIDSAKLTIDASIYNINRFDLRDRLVAAHDRGVKIRYVANEDTANEALVPSPPFPVIFSNNINLMHNKFMSIDSELEDESWVMSGSMNWTTGSIYSDFNNVIWLQDQSLARTYRLEMDEMWGSTGAQPDVLNARFGASKKDNTPHFFRIGGREVEQRFSPSDGTNQMILNQINAANHELGFALLSFTKDDLGDGIISKWQNEAVDCRGIIDNPNDNGSEFAKFAALGMPIKADDKPAVVHHKYGVFDWLNATSDPTVVTGSHNWSLTAETGNDENTLAIHDPKIALIYAMEFEKRFAEIVVKTGEPDTGKSGWKIEPNPATNFFKLTSESVEQSGVRVEIFDGMGKLLTTRLVSGKTAQFSTENWPAGFYFLKIRSAEEVTDIPVLLARD